MDRPIKKKKLPLSRLVFIIVCVIIAFLAYQVLTRAGTTRLKVDPSRMTVSEVEYGEFLEYYPFDGRVVPVTSVYLDVEQGGRVDEIFVEGGQAIEKGDLILRFSNPGWQAGLITNENSLLETLDSYQNTQLRLAQGKLNRRETLMRLNYELLQLERQYKRYNVLKKEKIVISEQEYENLMDNIEYKKAQIELQKERNKQEDLMSEKQLEKANKAIERLNIGLELIAKQIDSLELRADISGHISNINAEIGQKINPGQRIGQIDILDKFKIQAGVDEYYISKVTLGTKGKFTLDGNSYGVEVIKISSEVLNNVLTVDMSFIGDPPEGIKRGQTLTTELNFSEAEECLMVKKGGFYQETSGRWVYLISEDGKSAYRQDIRLGRQNPRYVEIIEGLREGDWVITSGYDTFKKADELLFAEPLNLND